MDTTRRSAARDGLPTPEADPRVADFLAEVRAEYRAPLPNDVVSDHLRMILAEAAVAPTAPGLRDRGARWARRIAAVGAVKIALTATAAAAATGTGLAATNNLPAPAQAVVADAAGLVGITLPTPETPGDRADGKPGIGEGGVPALLETGDDADLPGKAGDAPGLNRDADGRPSTPEQSSGAEHGKAGEANGAQRGNAGRTGGAERAPEADERPGRTDKGRTAGGD